MLPEWNLNGAANPRYHGNLNVRREGVNALRLMSDARNVAFSLGSACGSGSGKVSHVLRAMGVSEADARASIRLGWGRYTTEQELRDGLNAIKRSEEHTSELQSLMRISYAVFCLKKKNKQPKYQYSNK